MIKPRYAILPLSLLVACTAAAEVFQCKQSNGVMSFQSLPCQEAPSTEDTPESCPPPDWLALTKDGDCGDLKLMRYRSTYKLPVTDKAGDGWQSEKLTYATCANVVFFLCEALADDADTSTLAERFELSLDNSQVLTGTGIRITSSDPTAHVYESEICFGCPECTLDMIVDLHCRKK